MDLRFRTAFFVAFALLAADADASPRTPNGFSLENASIPSEEILRGGPERDGIPALDHPPSVSAAESPWPDHEIVVGIEIDGVARAYPLSILVWHELVNDTLGSRPVLISYCPLCGTAMVFDRRIGGITRRFGVSGLLYLSDMLLFDRETESLWSQIRGEAVTGSSRGQRFSLMRSRQMSWGDWKRLQPATQVLSKQTGHRRDYGKSPYGDYATNERLIFPVPLDRRYHPKTPTLGLREVDGASRAYPAVELVRAGGRIREAFAGKPVSVAYDGDAQIFQFEAPPEIEVVEGYWFAWMAFHPESTVYRAPAARTEGEVP